MERHYINTRPLSKSTSPEGVQVLYKYKKRNHTDINLKNTFLVVQFSSVSILKVGPQSICITDRNTTKTHNITTNKQNDHRNVCKAF